MKYIAGIALLSFTCSFLLTPLFRNWGRSMGWVDHPDNRRKVHRNAVPRIGGIPIMISFAVSCAFLSIICGSSTTGLLATVFQVMPAAAIIFAAGLTDDVLGLRPWQKLVVQILAAVLACTQGIQLDSFGGFDISGYWWHVPLTVFWLVACTNAFNLIDGVDGLAAGVGFFAAITILIAALLQQNFALAAAAAPVAAALCGFLCYNFNPATIFLGDCGSLSIGFLLGCYSVLWSQKSTTMLGMTAPLLALCIPLLDTVLAIARRFIRGRPIFGADRHHIHHRLLELGLSVRKVALVLYGVAGLAAVCSLLVSAFQNNVGGMVLAVFCFCAWFGIYRLGYAEFGGVKRVLLGGVIRQAIVAEIALRQIEDRLKAARTVDDCWPILRDIGKQFNFCRVEARLNGQSQSVVTSDSREPQWQMSVPLSGSDFVRFVVPLGTEQSRLAILIRLVHRNLKKKCLQEVGALAAEPSLFPLIAAVQKPAKASGRIDSPWSPLHAKLGEVELH
jgi:UDP-GlcNAc:undecaprenyl-phosphate GlcNAc-1-phosphate transferase